MNVAVFKEAQAAYARGDYETALDDFIECVRDTSSLSPSDLSKFYHLIGNCYVKSGDPYAAASAYTHALKCSPEKRKPSLYVNLGTALLGCKQYDDALTAFTRALDYPIYATPYKAYAGIGAAQLKLGNMTEAGAAYREAALDPTNPDPAKALVNLGVCFMELGRAKDAITSYETALEFNLTPAASAKAHANLGQAYMAEGRINKALRAFEAATADGLELSPMAQHDYEIAKALHDKLETRAPGVLDTGFIPNVAMIDEGSDAVEEPAEMPLDASGHLPVYGEPNFDPFAPQTQSMEAVRKQEDDKKGKAGHQEESKEEPEEEPEQAPEENEQPLSRAASKADGPQKVEQPASEAKPEVKEPEKAIAKSEAQPTPKEELRAKPASRIKTRKVSVDGVDEDELERTLIELGIAPEQSHSLWPEETPEEEAAESASFGDRLPWELGDAPENAQDEPEEISEDYDSPAAKTQAIPQISSNSSLDIPTEEIPVTRAEDASSEDTGALDTADFQDGDFQNEADDRFATAPIEQVSGFEDTGELEGTQEFALDGFVSERADSGEPLNLENTDTHMPSPEDTQFFEVSEDEINAGAKEERKKARKSRGVGLKVAVVVVILAVVVAAAGAAAYIMGYGYPTQEHVTRSFFAAVNDGSDTSQYWADDVDESSREAQVASLQNLNSYNVEAVQRSMSQTAVYVKGTLEEGGQIDYQVVLNRKGLSWAIEYVELYFPSQQ